MSRFLTQLNAVIQREPVEDRDRFFGAMLKPQVWPAWMPSISLLALIAAVVPLIVKLNLVYERKSKGLRV